MSFKKPLDLLYFVLAEGYDVQKQGLVLYMTGTQKSCTKAVTGLASTYTVCYVAPCPADTRPIGIAYKTTENYNYPTTTPQYETGVEVGVVREGEVNVPYHLSANMAVACGNIMGMKDAITAGHVNLHVPTAWPLVYAAATSDAILAETGYVVGVAKECITASTASQMGYIKLLMNIHDVISDHATQ